MVKEKDKMKDAIYTKYEVARIIGARALQLSMNAPMLLDIKKEELESMQYDPLKIAEKEFRAGILPITVKRPLPQPRQEEEEEVKEEEEVEIQVEEKEESKEDQAAEMAAEPEDEKPETE